MDSGYFNEEIVEVIEEEGYQYIVKTREYLTCLIKLMTDQLKFEKIMVIKSKLYLSS